MIPKEGAAVKTITSFEILWNSTLNEWMEVSRDQKKDKHELLSAALDYLNNGAVSDLYDVVEIDVSSLYISTLYINNQDPPCFLLITNIKKEEEYRIRASCAILSWHQLAGFRHSMSQFIVEEKPLSIEVQLTPREEEVLAFIRQGLTQKEISTKLGIAESTVETYKSRLFKKFKVHSSIELIGKIYRG